MKNSAKRMIAWMLAAALCLGVCAQALAEEQEYLLPDERHYLRVPVEMEWQQPYQDETSLKGIWLMPPDLEMLVFAYDAEGRTVQELAEALVDAGKTAEVREIAGQDFLVFQDLDEEDGALCVGYSYVNDRMMVEISFFYASQAAMDLTQVIMESFHQ